MTTGRTGTSFRPACAGNEPDMREGHRRASYSRSPSPLCAEFQGCRGSVDAPLTRRRGAPARAKRAQGGTAPLSAVAAPFPRGHRQRIRPQPSPGAACLRLQAAQRRIARIANVHPGHAAAHLLGVGIDAVAIHARHSAPVSVYIDRLEFHRPLETQLGQRLAGARRTVAGAPARRSLQA